MPLLGWRTLLRPRLQASALFTRGSCQLSTCRLFQTRAAATRIAEITGKMLIFGTAVGPR
jgi:hypothetical protein